MHGKQSQNSPKTMSKLPDISAAAWNGDTPEYASQAQIRIAVGDTHGPLEGHGTQCV